MGTSDLQPDQTKVVGNLEPTTRDWHLKCVGGPWQGRVWGQTSMGDCGGSGQGSSRGVSERLERAGWVGEEEQ